MNKRLLSCCGIILLFLSTYCSRHTATSKSNNRQLFARDNLVAWCTIPYDSKKRSAEERAKMLKELGFTSFAYDWRAPDLANMEAELATLKKWGIRLKSVWFWVDGGKNNILDEANETILQTIEKTNTKTELWLSFPNQYFKGLPDKEKVEKAVKTLQYLHKRTSLLGCTIALYNHEDWFGEPANEVKIIEASGLKDVKMVYNFHRGHKQVDDFDNILKLTKPYLTTVNLNGMKGRAFEIRTIGQGDYELEMLRKLKASGFNGSIGILGHTENEDVKVVLQRNIEGLKMLLNEMSENEALKSYQ